MHVAETSFVHSRRSPPICSSVMELGLGTLEPEGHPHFAEGRGGGCEAFDRLLFLPRSPQKPADTELALGAERRHPQIVGQRIA